MAAFADAMQNVPFPARPAPLFFRPVGARAMKFRHALMLSLLLPVLAACGPKPSTDTTPTGDAPAATAPADTAAPPADTAASAVAAPAAGRASATWQTIWQYWLPR